MTSKTFTGAELRTLRKSFGLSQKAFWHPLGVTQATSSRYEKEQLPLPITVRILLEIVFGNGLLTENPKLFDLHSQWTEKIAAETEAERLRNQQKLPFPGTETKGI